MSTDLNRPGSVKPVAADGQRPDLNRGVRTEQPSTSKAGPSQPEREQDVKNLALDEIIEGGQWRPKSEPIIMYAPEDLVRLRAFHLTCGLLAGILIIGALTIAYVTVQGYEAGGLTWFYGAVISALTVLARLYFQKANPAGSKHGSGKSCR